MLIHCQQNYREFLAIFNAHHEADDDTLLAEPISEEALDLPRRFVVVLYNDDYTPMDFVVDVLQRYFNLPLEKAVEVMLSVHHEGYGIAGIYPKDIAETKSQMVNQEAQNAGYPLLTRAEPE